MRIETESIGDIRQTEVGQMPIKDVKINVYPTGKFYVAYLLDGLLDKIIEDTHKEASDKFDSLVLIQGGEGSGKSNLTWNAIEKHSPGFNIRDVYCYNFEEFQDKVMSQIATGGDRMKPYWMDEAINVVNKRSWNSSQNVEFTEWTMMMRSRLWTLFMIAPDYGELDYYVRDHRCKYILTCAENSFPNTGYKKRGYFHAKKRTQEGWKDLGYGEYDPMPDYASVEYEKVKEESQIRKINDSKGEKSGSKYKAKYEEERKKIRSAVLAMHNSKVNREAIKQLFGIETDSAYYSILKRAKEDQGLI